MIFEAGTVNENHVLKGLDFQVEEGDFLFRSSEAGKSTFNEHLGIEI